MEKRVAIVIPCYNQGEFLKDAIDSALNQTYKNIKIVCVNDCSNDNTFEIMKDYSQKYKNFLFFNLEENKGVVYSRNLAIDSAYCDYVLPLDADDKIESTYVERAVKILNEKPEVGIVYCKARFFGEIDKFWNLPDFDEEQILFNNCIFSCAMFRK